MYDIPDRSAPWADPQYAFSGIPSFLRAPLAAQGIDASAEIGVLGVPADFGSPFMPGSRFGPRGIREHSLQFGSEGYFDARAGRTLLRDEKFATDNSWTPAMSTSS